MRYLLILTATLAFGCAAPAPTARLLGSNDTSRPADADDDDDRDAATDAEQPVVVEDGDRSTVTPVPAMNGSWHGRLSRADAVDFGGGVFCDYRVVLSAIDVTLTLDAQGRVTSSRIVNTMTETTTTSCQASPLGVRQNDYAFDASNDAPATLLAAATLAPDAKNLPLANATIAAELLDAQRMHARLVFQRTGGAAPSLDWKITADVLLTRP